MAQAIPWVHLIKQTYLFMTLTFWLFRYSTVYVSLSSSSHIIDVGVGTAVTGVSAVIKAEDLATRVAGERQKICHSSHGEGIWVRTCASKNNTEMRRTLTLGARSVVAYSLFPDDCTVDTTIFEAM